MDPIRRRILKTGAAATAMAAAPRVFAQRIPLAVRQIRSFLRAHRPASA
jgi:hypothetical protein